MPVIQILCIHEAKILQKTAWINIITVVLCRLVLVPAFTFAISTGGFRAEAQPWLDIDTVIDTAFSKICI